MAQDKQITCTSCGTEFLFSVADQEFFSSRGYTEPRRCRPCRNQAKQQRGGAGQGGGYGAYQSAPRELFDAVCAACGTSTQVPFRPNGTKPVYCGDCFRAKGR